MYGAGSDECILVPAQHVSQPWRELHQEDLGDELCKAMNHGDRSEVRHAACADFLS